MHFSSWSFGVCLAFLSIFSWPCSALHTVTYDSRSFLIDGQRTLLLSGSIHYQRLFPSDWPRALGLAVENGLNTIQTYVTWDEHEPQQGAISFSGKNNITAFTALAASLGLKVVVRIGPYICGEHFNGGVPLWMRAPPSAAQCFRCSDPTWLSFSEHVLGAVVSELKTASQLWTQGGPVIALQVENEYGGGDVGYLKAVVAQARALTTDVPWILCHDLALCSEVNVGAAGEGGNALCTINGFWEDDSAEGVQQPSPAFMAGQRKNNPGQPLSWTEDQGWFDQWGAGQRVRRPSDILYGFSRAVAYGLSHHNFYMFTGGNNYGYSAANGVATAYAPDTAVDNLLLRHQPKFSTFAAFHATLASVADALLGVPPPPPTPLGKNCEMMAYGEVTLVSNMGTSANATEVVVVGGVPFTMPNHTVVFLRGSQVLFNTSAAPDFAAAAAVTAAATTVSSPPAWVTLVEKLGYGNRSASPAPGAPPLEQLGLTQNLVDYMYYTLTLPTPLNESTVTVNTCGGEYVYLFEGGGVEAAGAVTAAAAAATTTITPSRTSHTFVLPPRAAAGTTTTSLSILVSAMGLSTSPSPGSCKGVTRVMAGGSKGRDLTHLGWVSHWVFEGEAQQVYTPAGAAAAPWAPVPPSGGTTPTAWFKALVDAPPTPPSHTAPATIPQLAYALDLNGATKGVVWFNGVNLGRYNLELGVCTGDCAPPHHGTTCYIFWRNCGLSTQRYYHVPAELVLPTGNLVVLFEETATVPVAGQGPAQPSPPPPAPHRAPTGAPPSGGVPRDLSHVALVALTEHP